MPLYLDYDLGAPQDVDEEVYSSEDFIVKGRSRGGSGENSRDKKHKEIMEYDEADFQRDEDNDGYADEYPEVIDITISQTTCLGMAYLGVACLGVAWLGVACLDVALRVGWIEWLL